MPNREKRPTQASPIEPRVIYQEAQFGPTTLAEDNFTRIGLPSLPRITLQGM